jgi:predicted Zn-dependent peptidase
MKLFERRLSNGLRLQAVAMPGTQVVTTMILVGAGSRYETRKISGISHFLEHMFFKGAEKYKTPKEVSEAVDSFGGVFNAFTGKEYAGYFIKSNKSNLEKSVDVLSDMLLRSKFNPVEIEKERGVILEEMAMYLDAPMYQISWDFERLVFGDQPLGRDQIGTRELIQQVTRQQFLDYKSQFYTPDNMVITLAGAVEEKDLDLLESYFSMGSQKKSQDFSPFDPSLATDRYKIRAKKTEQYHLALGVKSPAETDVDYPTSRVLATILGGNMSARMFQHVREQKGLCYSIRTQIDEYSDAGLLVTQAGVKVSAVWEAMEAITQEYKLIREQGITDQELKKAQNYISGKIDLGTEDSEDIAHEYAKNRLLYDKVESSAMWKDRIWAVKKSEVADLSRRLFTPENFRLAGIGPALDEDRILEIWKR